MIKTRVLWDMSDRSTPLTSVIVSAVHKLESRKFLKQPISSETVSKRPVLQFSFLLQGCLQLCNTFISLVPIGNKLLNEVYCFFFFLWRTWYSLGFISLSIFLIILLYFYFLLWRRWADILLKATLSLKCRILPYTLQYSAYALVALWSC